jgi:hypothetical protein
LNITRLVEKIFIRSFLIVTLFALQSCSNTLIGEKLESSFDSMEKPRTPEKTNTKSILKDDKKENKDAFANTVEENSISNKDRLSKKITKSKKKTIFNPQPYRIILRLSGANPSAPAETVTEALRTAGVQFEVEKIERFDEEDLSKDSSFKR